MNYKEFCEKSWANTAYEELEKERLKSKCVCVGRIDQLYDLLKTCEFALVSDSAPEEIAEVVASVLHYYVRPELETLYTEIKEL